ncbi:hypothetical protein DB88DRAFT_475883 [Papiliotrema laurentii]|uniref:Zinc-ribbon 15 domain-containing protein n=1 Tax=Papiliotrema laurentii TaxID=5418 RepID=A0AAD9L877_PAPLA|nr:hypothetical protein DB88DRAFT_475883 [Papiliotrema laurentii]
MVGVYYSSRPLVTPPMLCPQCCRGQLEGRRTRRIAHFCGIPLIPLGSDAQLICWHCGFQVFLPKRENRFYPGRRNVGPFGLQGYRGRTAEYDRRERYTFRFWPRYGRLGRIYLPRWL